MSRPRTVSDEAILEAARAVFLESGPSASIAVIAARLGLSQAALFKRFGTKADLMTACLAPPAIPAFATMLDAGPDARDPQEQLAEFAVIVARFFVELVPCITVLSSAGIPPIELLQRYDVPPPVRILQGVTAWMERAMDQGLVRRGDAVAMASALLGALHMRAFLCHVTQTPLPDDAIAAHARSVVSALWQGLAPQETP